MAEVVERVAKLEERSDNVATAIVDLRAAVSKLDTNMQAGFSEVRAEFTAVRQEFGSEISGLRGEISGLRREMHTEFRWILGGIGGATLTILVAVLAAILAKS